LVAKDQQGRPLTDAKIRQIRNGAAWKASVFLNNGQTLDLYTHNAGRPMTAAELRGADSPVIRGASLTRLNMQEEGNRPPRVVDFTQPSPLDPNQGIGSFQDRQNPNGQAVDIVLRRWTNSIIPAWAPLQGGFKFNWTVSNSQIPPFLLFVTGQVVMDWEGEDVANRQSFEDSRRLRFDSLSSEVFCAPTPPANIGGVTSYDKSCDADLDDKAFKTYTRDQSNNYIYNPGAWMTSTALISRDQQQRSIIRGYMWFIPTSSEPN
jgi:hypothetical protein